MIDLHTLVSLRNILYNQLYNINLTVENNNKFHFDTQYHDKLTL